MSNPIETWRDLAPIWKGTAAVVAVLATLALGATSWASLSLPVPAWRHYVDGRFDQMQVSVNQIRLGQLDTNELREKERRDFLESELAKSNDPVAARIIKDRLAEIGGQLSKIDRSRKNILRALAKLGYSEE